MGAAYGGMLVSDFYAAYTSYAGRHQYCWAHLLRAIDDLVGRGSIDVEFQGSGSVDHSAA